MQQVTKGSLKLNKQKMYGCVRNLHTFGDTTHQNSDRNLEHEMFSKNPYKFCVGSSKGATAGTEMCARMGRTKGKKGILKEVQ